ncbi:MAG: alpha-L-fucosidase [Prevotella sp.]|jgi:alpha-L-fucosidase|nr:alpha-L-fucosidase [Prevotella sp.]
MKNTSISILLLLLSVSYFSCKQNNPPVPYGAIPTEHQIAWQQLEYYMFIHFGPNTFTDVEWGDGQEDPKVFNPTDLDCQQWAATAKAAGMKGIIITAKHHDGFCLWPSKYSTHTVRESSWKNGKGDVLKELSDACKEYGLKFGVYLSPWDQNHPAYGTPEYNQIFANTLDEVLSNYGEVFEQWFDGANGGHGKKQVYDWNLFHKTVYEKQPQAIIFSDVGPGCRWMGNERGVAGETNWSTMNIEGFEPGHGAPPTNILNSGEEGGQAWVPAETDVSIRPGWFYSPATDDKVKSVEKLVDIYYTSVGRNSNLLLNVPPDRRGRIHPNDSVRLMEFRQSIEKDFAINLIKDADIQASDVRGNAYRVANTQDGRYNSYWATNDSVLNPWIEVDFKKETAFNRLMLQEYIPLGQRIKSFTVKYWDQEKEEWSNLANATTIGYKRILRFPTINTARLRVEFEGLACPAISELGVFHAQEFLSPPIVDRDRFGIVTIRCESPDPVIYYTTDGSEPSVNSIKYEKELSLKEGGIVKAISVINNGVKKSEIVTADYDVSSGQWKVLSESNEDYNKAIDGNNRTYVTIPITEALTIDLGKGYSLKGFTYTPQGNINAANISRYNFYVSNDGNKWDKVKNNAVFNNIKNNPIKQDILFENIIQTRYIKLEPTELANKNDKYVIAELGIITR